MKVPTECEVAKTAYLNADENYAMAQRALQKYEADLPALKRLKDAEKAAERSRDSAQYAFLDAVRRLDAQTE